MFTSTARMLVRQPGRRNIMWIPNRKQEGLAWKTQIKQNFSSECCSGHLEHRFNTPAVYIFCSESKFNENLKIVSSKPLFLQHVPSETKNAIWTILPIPFVKSQEGLSWSVNTSSKVGNFSKNRFFIETFHWTLRREI